MEEQNEIKLKCPITGNEITLNIEMLDNHHTFLCECGYRHYNKYNPKEVIK